MSLAVWNENYSVGSQIIDRQHEQLFDLVNELDDAMSKGHSRNVLDAVLDKLIRYTQTHFTEEEAAMAQSGFPGLEGHKKEHRQLMAQVKVFQEEFRSGNVVIGPDVTAFLNTWLSDHILENDQAYVPYVSARAAASSR